MPLIQRLEQSWIFHARRIIVPYMFFLYYIVLSDRFADWAGLYGGNSTEQCAVEWNPNGNQLMFENFPFPIVIMTNEADVQFLLQKVSMWKIEHRDIYYQIHLLIYYFANITCCKLLSFFFLVIDDHGICLSQPCRCALDHYPGDFLWSDCDIWWSTPALINLFGNCLLIIILYINPEDVERRYTGFAQTSLWRRTPVYRLCANFPVASEAGIPAARYVNARRRTPVYRLCFLQLTGTGIPES